MSRRNLYGEPTLTLSEAVDELMIAQENDKRNHYFTYLNHAKWIWKEIVRSTIWAVVQKVIEVPEDGRIKLPAGVGRRMSISVVDHYGNIQVIEQNPNMNTLLDNCETTKCSCRACKGENSLCDLLDQISVRNEEVVIDDGTTIETYQKRVWNRKDEAGNLIEVSEIPYFDAEKEEVVYSTDTRVICAMDVDEKCCIQPTDRNRRLFFEHCGCFMWNLLPYWPHKDSRERWDEVDIPPLKSDYGYWKFEANSDDTIWLKHSKAKKIIVMYAADAESDSSEEMLVPEFALNSLHAGMMWRQKFFSPVTSLKEKREAKMEYRSQKSDMRSYLFPLNVSAFLRAGAQLPKL